MTKNPLTADPLTEAEANAVCSVLVTRLGGSYSRLLGINLAGMESDESFKWFVAAVLLDSPASTGSALSAFRELEAAGLLDVRHLQSVEWKKLVELLVAAGVRSHVRRVAGTLQLSAASLVTDYDADINRLHFFAEDGDDLVQRLRHLGRTVPRGAVDLFLREMRGVWDKARPCLSDAALSAARSLGVLGACSRTEGADELRSLWDRADHGGRTYADFEAALVRLGESYCQVRLCNSCPMNRLCISRHPEPCSTGDSTATLCRTGNLLQRRPEEVSHGSERTARKA